MIEYRARLTERAIARHSTAGSKRHAVHPSDVWCGVAKPEALCLSETALDVGVFQLGHPDNCGRCERRVAGTNGRSRDRKVQQARADFAAGRELAPA